MITDFKKHFSLNITLLTVMIILIPFIFLEVTTTKETFTFVVTEIIGICGATFLGIYWSQQLYRLSQENKQKYIFYFFIGLIWHELQYDDTILASLQKNFDSLTPLEMVHIAHISRRFGMMSEISKRLRSDAYYAAQKQIHEFFDKDIFNEIELSYYNVKIFVTTIEEVAFNIKERQIREQQSELTLFEIERDIENYITRLRDELIVTRAQIKNTLDACHTLLVSEGLPTTNERYSLIT